MIGFEACFPLCPAFPQNIQAWSVKECEIYSKSHCCLFLTVSRVVLSSPVWSCLLLRISSLFSCDSLLLFGTRCHQEKQLFQSESLLLLSCSPVDCIESMKCYNATEKRGAWRNEEWDHTAGIYRRGLISCHIVHSGCVWNQICYHNRNPLMETWISDPNSCFTVVWDLRVCTRRRELTSLIVWGDLTASPGCSCWGDGGFDKCYGKNI